MLTKRRSSLRNLKGLGKLTQILCLLPKPLLQACHLPNNIYYSAKLRMPFISGASPMLDGEVISGMGEQGNYICFIDHGFEGPMTPKTLPWVERYKIGI
jgi:hypothetical protein